MLRHILHTPAGRAAAVAAVGVALHVMSDVAMLQVLVGSETEGNRQVKMPCVMLLCTTSQVSKPHQSIDIGSGHQS